MINEKVEEQLKESVKEKIDPSKVKVIPPSDHIEGVKPHVAQVFEKMLNKGRRYFGSSAAGMTQQVNDESFVEEKSIKKEKASEYLEAEREISKIIKKWLKNKPNAVLIDSVSVPDFDEDYKTNSESGIIDRDGNTDHIIIIGSEVILLDTKLWDKKKAYSVGDNGESLRTNKEFYGSEVLMKDSLELWLDYLSEDAFLTGIVVVNNEECSVLRNRNWYTQIYRLVEIDRFIELLNEKWETIEEEDKYNINTDLVAQVAVKCIKPVDPYEKVFDMNSLKKFR